MTGRADENIILRVKKLRVLKKQVEVLHPTDLDFARGEIHAVIGDHDSGKTLLAGVISGAIRYESGELVYEGKAVRNYSPIKARRLGIASIHQNPAVFGYFSVIDNIVLRSLPASSGRRVRLIVTEQARQKLRSFGVDLDLRAPLARCSESESLVVYIVRGLCTPCKVLVVDGISARLSPAQIETLHSELSLAQQKGVTVIYFTSNVEEAYHFANRISFLQRGRVLATEEASNLGKLELVQLSYSHLYSRKELERSNYELFYLKNYYENIINSMPFPLLLLNSQGTIIYVNTRFSAAYEVDKNRHVGREVSSLFRPGTPEHAHFCGRQPNPSMMARFDDVMLTIPDAREPARLYGVPIYDDEGSFLGSILLFDTLEVEVDFERYNKSIQAYKRVPLFAHEIRNPLAILSNFLTLIKNKSSSQEMKDYLARSETEIKRINNIISNLMKEGVAASDRAKPQGTKLWLLAEEIRTLIMPMIAAKPIDLHNRTAQDVLLEYDEDELKEVLINLVLNAIEAITDSGTVVVDSAVERVKEKPFIVIRVTDDGAGIAPENLERVFEPFFSTKTGKERRGLGLSICKDVVGALGGMITVDSVVDEGTVVKVLLPYQGSGVTE